MKKMIIFAMTLVTIMTMVGCQKKEETVPVTTIEWNVGEHVAYEVTVCGDDVEVVEVTLPDMILGDYEAVMKLYERGAITKEMLYEIRLNYDATKLNW